MLYLLRSSAIVCDPAIIKKPTFCALRSKCIIFLILTDNSTLLSHKAQMFVYNNARLLWTWLALNVVAQYECVYSRNSKNFKDKHKKSNSWEKIGEKFNLSCLFMDIFRTQNRCFLRFWSWRCRRFRTKRRNKFGCSKISSSMSAMLFGLIFPRAQHASTLDISAERNVWLQRATIGSAIVCDRLRLCGNSSL